MKYITFALMNQSMKRLINSCMKRAINGLIFGLIPLASVTTQQIFATGESSEDAKDKAGAKGTIEFKPTD
jgi:hypothetical protein